MKFLTFHYESSRGLEREHELPARYVVCPDCDDCGEALEKIVGD